MTNELTSAQARILAEVTVLGHKVYEARNYPAIAELERLGLVTVQVNHYIANRSARTGRGTYRKTYTVSEVASS